MARLRTRPVQEELQKSTLLSKNKIRKEKLSSWLISKGRKSYIGMFMKILDDYNYYEIVPVAALVKSGLPPQDVDEAIKLLNEGITGSTALVPSSTVDTAADASYPII